MTSPKDTDAEAHAGAGESPGRMIARAREAASIGAADLAVRLRLDTRVIKALERDDFENLPAPMFVKGYIRSIAKELNVDADAILSAYEVQTSVEPPSLADFSSRAPDQVGINSTSIKVVTYGLVALLVVLIALWWRSNYQVDSDGEPAAEPDTGSVDSAVPLPYSFDIVEHDEPGWRVAPPPDAIAEPPTDENADVGTLPPPAESMATTHSLSVSTASEAWVEIYDRAGERLYFGMARAGRAVTLDGQDYYRLILGNTDSITLTYDGQTIDLAPYAQQGVAQLELGQVEPAGASAL